MQRESKSGMDFEKCTGIPWAECRARDKEGNIVRNKDRTPVLSFGQLVKYLVDHVFPDLNNSAAELIILWVARHTAGFGKWEKGDWLSGGQFRYGKWKGGRFKGRRDYGGVGLYPGLIDYGVKAAVERGILWKTVHCANCGYEIEESDRLTEFVGYTTKDGKAINYMRRNVPQRCPKCGEPLRGRSKTQARLGLCFYGPKDP